MGKVELHAHTIHSMRDGICEVEDLIRAACKYAKENNETTTLAITDHDSVRAFPKIARNRPYVSADDPGKSLLKVIFGYEGNMIDEERGDGYRNEIVILVKNQKGFNTLYKLMTYASCKCDRADPYIPKHILAENREGILIGSTGCRGELYRAVLNDVDDSWCRDIANFYDYIELQPTDDHNYLIYDGLVECELDLCQINEKLYHIAKETGTYIAASTDLRYFGREDAERRDDLISTFEMDNKDIMHSMYWRTEQEMIKEFSYLGAEEAYRVVVTDPNKIAGMIDDDIYPDLGVPYGPCSSADARAIIDTGHRITNTVFRNAETTYGEPLPDMRCPVCGQSMEKNGSAILSAAPDRENCLLSFEDETRIWSELYLPDTITDFGLCGKVKEVFECQDKEVYRLGCEQGILIEGDGFTEGSNAIVDFYPVSDFLVLPGEICIYDISPLDRYEEEGNEGTFVHFKRNDINDRYPLLEIRLKPDLMMISQLEDCTGISARDIDMRDSKTMAEIREGGIMDQIVGGNRNWTVVANNTEAKNIDELIKALALTWNYIFDAPDDGSDIKQIWPMVKSGDIPVTKEDVFRYCLELGIGEEQARKITRYVTNGGCGRNDELDTLLQKSGADDATLDYFRAVFYIASKSGMARRAMTAYRLAWYKTYYPEEFFKVYKANECYNYV